MSFMPGMVMNGNPHPIAGAFQPTHLTVQTCKHKEASARLGAVYACYEQAFGNLAFSDGPAVALESFIRDQRRDTFVQRDCHRMAHMIGSATLAREHGNVAKAFSEGSSTCWSGFYHGILERALTGKQTTAAVKKAVGDLCTGAYVSSTPFLKYQCVHGLGHALMIHSGFELPWSLSMCDSLTTTWDQTSCDGGVFMQNFDQTFGVTSPYLRASDPLYPCDAVAARHKLYCYLQVTDRVLPLVQYRWARAAAVCRGAETAWRDTCFESFGRSASGFSRRNLNRLLMLCGIANGFESSCIYGAVRDISAQDAGIKRAATFCKTVATKFRARCFYGLGTIYADLLPNQRLRLRACRQTSKQYADFCALARYAPST